MDRVANASSLHRLSARQVANGIRRRDFGIRDVVNACLARIRERDGVVRAWVDLDDDAIARQISFAERSGGPLAGVPFGVKDVLDAAGLPTGMGSSLYCGHAPRYDAGCVGQLRMAGGVVLGKTQTCEFAGIEPAPTRNPHDPSRTPGGSSSGSAAAVADCMVPLALGTQTGGSVLRPAAFCGVVGFKPTYGFYAVSGMKEAAHSFDTPGLLARTVDDIAMVHGLLMNEAEPELPASAPRIGVPEGAMWDRLAAPVAAALRDAIAELARQGAEVVRFKLSPDLRDLAEARAIVNAFERSRDLAGEWLGDRNALGPSTFRIVERGFGIAGSDYVAARRVIERARASASEQLRDFDVMAMPVTADVAPPGLGHTGDPKLQENWTALHMPAMAIPVSVTAAGLPIAVQLVARRFADRQLLAAALWIESALGSRQASAARD